MLFNDKYFPYHIVTISGLSLRVNDSEEYKLRLELLEGMDSMVRPVTTYSDVVNVSFAMVVSTLSDLVRRH